MQQKRWKAHANPKDNPALGSNITGGKKKADQNCGQKRGQNQDLS